jgi:hypothetical protein
LESYARLAPPPKRRSTRFPALKTLTKTIQKKLGSSLQNVQEEDSAALDQSPDVSSHGPASSDFKKHDESECSEVSVVKTLANKIHLPNFWHKKPEETEISFSMFLQVLHTVCGDKCLYSSRRRGGLVKSGYPTSNETSQDFSEYLS